MVAWGYAPGEACLCAILLDGLIGVWEISAVPMKETCVLEGEHVLLYEGRRRKHVGALCCSPFLPWEGRHTHSAPANA